MRMDFICKDTVNIYARKDIFIFTCNKQEFVYCFKMYLFYICGKMSKWDQQVSVQFLVSQYNFCYVWWDTVMYGNLVEVAATQDFMSRREKLELE